MAELLIMTENKKLSGDARIDKHRWYAGDVVTIQEDGHKWGPGELDDRQFRVVKLPKITAASLGHLLAPEMARLAAEATEPNSIVQRRAFKVDTAALDIELAKGAEVPLEKVLATTAEKPKLADPIVIDEPAEEVKL